MLLFPWAWGARCDGNGRFDLLIVEGEGGCGKRCVASLFVMNVGWKCVCGELMLKRALPFVVGVVLACFVCGTVACPTECSPPALEVSREGAVLRAESAPSLVMFISYFITRGPCVLQTLSGVPCDCLWLFVCGSHPGGSQAAA